MTITLAWGTSVWTVAVRLRLSWSSSPKSRRTMFGLASRTCWRASSTSADGASTRNPGWVWIIAASPSRRSRLSSMSTRAIDV